MKIRVALERQSVDPGGGMHVAAPPSLKQGLKKFPHSASVLGFHQCHKANLNSESPSYTHALHAWAGLGALRWCGRDYRVGVRESLLVKLHCHQSFSLKMPSKIMQADHGGHPEETFCPARAPPRHKVSSVSLSSLLHSDIRQNIRDHELLQSHWSWSSSSSSSSHMTSHPGQWEGGLLRCRLIWS